MIRYETNGRNGYVAVDLYDNDVCIRNVYIGRRKDSEQVAAVANEAVHRAFPLSDHEKDGLRYAIDDLLGVYGADEETHTDDDVARVRQAVDGLTALRDLLG